MNKILYNCIRCLMLFSVAVALMFLPSCKKDAINAPVITGVRNYAPASGDSLIHSLVPGQWVVLLGHNLKNAVQITFDGISTNFNPGLFSDTSAVVQIPSVIPFPSIPAEQLNTIHYVTPEGATTFRFQIVAPPPTITSISNENANANDSVYLYGLNFFFIQGITFAGTQISAYSASGDGTSVGFVLPALSQSGPVIISTQSGADTTEYNVNDVTTGALCNFDNVNTLSWGTNTDNNSTNFPGNRDYYAILNNGILSAGDNQWWNWQRGINSNGVQWLPVSSLNDPVDKYAVKFEISVPTAWNGTSIFIVKDYNWNYLARYEPWRDANGATFSFTTRGWHTVSIPLSMFRTNNGKGTAAPDLTTLLGSSANGSINIYSINDGSSPTATGLNAAIDNIRVVRIK